MSASLFVTLLLHFTAGERQTSVTVRVGGDVTLPCGNAIKHQDRCARASWLFSRYAGESVREVIRLGQIGETVSRDTNERLSLTSTCALVIKNVATKDFGRYSCRQFDQEGKRLGEDAHVHLTVIEMEKYPHDSSVILHCGVLTFSGCGYTVKWLHDDEDGDEEVLAAEQFTCSATITIRRLRSEKTPFKCNVTDDQSGRTLLCDVDPQSSCVQTGGTSAVTELISTEVDTPPPAARPDCSLVNYAMLVLRAAQLVLVTVITVLFITVRRNQRAPEGNTVRHDGDEVDNIYETLGDDPASVKLKIKSAKN